MDMGVNCAYISAPKFTSYTGLEELYQRCFTTQDKRLPENGLGGQSQVDIILKSPSWPESTDGGPGFQWLGEGERQWVQSLGLEGCKSLGMALKVYPAFLASVSNNSNPSKNDS